MLSLLKDWTYLRYWCAIVVSFLGDGITRIAVVYLVGKLTTNPIMIALVIFAQFVPTALLGAFVGPLADRFPRLLLLMGSDLFRLAIVLLMIPFHESVWILISLVFLQGVGKAVFEPARIASIPVFVGNNSIPKAVALFQSTVATINIVGPMLAGILLVLNNVTLIFLINAMTYLMSACLLGSIAVLRNQKYIVKKKRSYLQSFHQGISGVSRIPALRFLLLISIPIKLVIGSFFTNYNALLIQVYQVSSIDFGLLEGVFAIGVIMGAGLGPMLMKCFNPGPLLLFSTALLGIAIACIYPLNQWKEEFGLPPIFIWCLLVGVFNGLHNVPLSSTFMQIIPHEMLGRGASLFQAIYHTFYIVGVMAGGWIAGIYGLVLTTTIIGMLLLLTAVIFPILKSYHQGLHQIKTNEQGKIEQGEHVSTSTLSH